MMRLMRHRPGSSPSTRSRSITEPSPCSRERRPNMSVRLARAASRCTRCSRATPSAFDRDRPATMPLALIPRGATNMQRINSQQWLLAGALALAQSFGIAAQPEVSAAQVVAAIEDAFGVTPGERRNHIKGTCATGEFVGLPAAAAVSRSGLFSGKPIPVVARFRLPGGGVQHMTMLNTPMFGATQPRTFLDLMIAIKPDPATGKPDPERIKAFRATHPDSRAQAEYLASNNPTSSYGNSAYWGVHTFKFVDRDNKASLVRWRFVPQDGEKRLSDEELKSSPANFLEAALIERTRQGP